MREAVHYLKETGVHDMHSKVFNLVHIYQNGKILDEVYTQNDPIMLYLRISPFIGDNIQINLARTKRLACGSLLCITDTTMKESVFAVVEHRLISIEINPNFIDVLVKGVGGQHLSILNFCSKIDINNLVVIECKAHFETHYNFLKAINQIDFSCLPFKSQIIDMEFKNKPPSYLKDSHFRITNKSLDCLKNPLSIDMDNPSIDKELSNLLDESQFKALQSILKNELAIVQGPPGTGKMLNFIMNFFFN